MSLTKLTGYLRALALLAIPAAGAIQGAALPAETSSQSAPAPILCAGNAATLEPLPS